MSGKFYTYIRNIFLVKDIPQLTWSSNNSLNLKPKPITLFFVILGLFLLGLGESLLISSLMGVSPWTVLAQGISFKTDLSIGMSILVINCIVLFLWIPLRQKMGIGTILNASIVPFVIGYSSLIIPQFQSLIYQFTQVVLGVILSAFGITLYLTANLGAGPRDGIMSGLQRKTNKSMTWVRIGLDISVVFIGWLLGGIVGIGTLFFAIVLGPCIGISIIILSPKQKFTPIV